MIVKHYRTEAEALKNCGQGQKVVREGNAVIRYRVADKNERYTGPGSNPQPRQSWPYGSVRTGSHL